MSILKNRIILQYLNVSRYGLSNKYSSYIGQAVNDPPIANREYDVSRNIDEWKYVTRLLNKRTVPAYIEKDKYPSGWIPPKDNCVKHPYYVERTKNHMLPLYLVNEDRGQRKITLLKKIHGDIWLLHQELKDYVEQQIDRKIPSQVLECNSAIKLKGDRYHWVETFLLSKGF